MGMGFGLSGQQMKKLCEELSIVKKVEINDLGFILTVLRDGTTCERTRFMIDDLLKKLEA